TGVVQEDGIININDKTSKYLGTGWTSLPPAKEDLITIKNQITMTTGLDDGVPDPNCLTPACLVYKADAGTRWAYHNAPYRLMQDVIAAASGQTFNAYSKAKLFDKIGAGSAFWLNYVMYCTTRDAARIGSLILRKGEWNGNKLLTDQNYFKAMTTTSQNINLSYGYLWWLNGKASSMVPQSQFVFPVSLVAAAPADMIMALGKDDKKIYVVPSLDVVVVRLGDDAGSSTLGSGSFDNEIWSRLKLAMKY
ncbi:MAG: serine hydrolase, partial [Ginsengibacter sp.]